jgi:hypothetical protein
MALTEQNIADKIEVVENGTVQVRTANIVLKDGVELARNFHRHTIAPGQDYSAEDAKVQAICAAVHTQEVIDAYLAAQSPA